MSTGRQTISTIAADRVHGDEFSGAKQNICMTITITLDLFHFYRKIGKKSDCIGQRIGSIRSCNTLKANVGPYRLHDLRHTYNTNMVKAGVDKVIIMKLTGHKTFNMFSRYTHLDQEQGEIAMGKLGDLLLAKEMERKQQKGNNVIEIGQNKNNFRKFSTPYLLPEAILN